jgi:hypothetical protein
MLPPLNFSTKIKILIAKMKIDINIRMIEAIPIKYKMIIKTEAIDVTVLKSS